MSRSTDAIPTARLAKVAAATAAEICAWADLSPEALDRLTSDGTPQDFLAALVRDGLRSDALRFLAHALPAREGVWWACVVAGAAPLTAIQAQCLARAEDWVYAPGEPERRSCGTAAEVAAFKGPHAYAALSAFWSGGSLAPKGMAEVAPRPYLAAVGITASLLLSLAVGDPAQGHERFRDILARGLDIAGGGNGRRPGDRPRQGGAEAAA